MGGRLPQRIFTETHQLLIETFDRQGVRLLLKSALKIRLYDICSPELHDSALFLKVMEWAEQNSRLAELIRAAAVQRPLEIRWQTLRARVSVPADEVGVETHRLIILYFTRDDLNELLRKKLGERMATITTPLHDNSAAALDVVEWFKNRGRICELIRAAALERSAVIEWQLLLDNHCNAAASALPGA